MWRTRKPRRLILPRPDDSRPIPEKKILKPARIQAAIPPGPCSGPGG